MKKIMLKGIFFTSAFLILISCNPKKDETSATSIDIEKIKKEIQERENEFASLYNSRQLKNIGYYADDAVVFSENHTPLIGKSAIIEYIEANMESTAKGNTISFHTNDVFVSNDGNQVVEIGFFNLVDSNSVSINSGNYMVVFEKRNDKYVSVREMSTSDSSTE